jgi:predicted amidohydrolase
VQLEVVAAQVRPAKADYAANLDIVGQVFAQIESSWPQTDLVVFPETALTGYFLEGGVGELARSADAVYADLLRTYRAVVTRDDAMLDIAVGFYESRDGHCYNSALYATLCSARCSRPHVAGIRHVHRKFFLPTYGVFDEQRFVSRGRTFRAFDTRFGRVAVLICEDAWHSISGTIAALDGAKIVIVVSASPGREFGEVGIGNLARWDRLLQAIAEEHGVFVVYSGLVGSEGGKGFTGSSRIVDPWGQSVVRGPVTEPCLVRAAVDLSDVALARAATPLLTDLESTLGDITAQLDWLTHRPFAAREWGE